MFCNINLNTIETFINTYFPFYAQDWTKLNEAEKNFLCSLLYSKNNSGYHYDNLFNSLGKASEDATGLYDFAICRDIRSINHYLDAKYMKDGVKFVEGGKKFNNDINEKGVLELMEKNPRAITVFYIFLSYYFRICDITKNELYSILESDKESAAKIKQEVGKGLRLDDYITFIYDYFDKHRLKNITFEFRKINGNHNTLEISCFDERIDFYRSEMKMFIPLLEYIDNHFFEFLTWAFMNDAEKTVMYIREEEKSRFTSLWKDSLTFI